jgi:hypothetical protein
MTRTTLGTVCGTLTEQPITRMTDDRTIRLSGEQAEVFDDQMDVDRDLMEATDDFIAFRPSIDGEWSEQIMLGYEPQRLTIGIKGTDEIYPGPYDWTCVVDVGRLVSNCKDASGMRVRFQCPNPNFEELRQVLRQAASQRVIDFLDILKRQPKRPRGFGK